MHPLAKTVPLMGILVAAAPAPTERDRTKIPDAYKWDLTPLYPNEAAWVAAQKKLAARLPEIERCQGKLGEAAGRLLECLDLMSSLRKDFVRLYTWANLSSDQDTRDTEALARVQEMRQLGSTFAAKAAFVEPEILKLDRARVEAMIGEAPGLAVYRHYLDDVLRRQAHTLSEPEERILASASLISPNAGTVYEVFSDADFPFPEVTLHDGKKVKLDKAAYELYRGVPHREDRRTVMHAFFTALDQYRRTFGATLDGEIKTHLFYARARKYGSSLEASLDNNNIPVAVYQALIDNVNKNLPTFHRYLRLHQRSLGVDKLHYHDLYAPIVAESDRDYSVEQAMEHVTRALRPLGPEYTGVLGRAFKERWLDFMPNEGKRSGAYSSGDAYDVHPYMLLNYNGKVDDVSTLAHELGHTMQSYLSNKTQPYPLADYPTFTAEVASTFNEALLIDDLLRNAASDGERIALLGRYLENIKGTVFRQTQFAEFELRIHELAEKGEALTGDRLDELYLQLARKYYGHDQGVCEVADPIKAEWAFIPHFYYNFYVFQYATSFTASALLAERVMAGDQAATKRYLEFLSAGGSDYPIELLRKAGVDMTTAEPFDATMRRMNRVMDELERLLDKTSKKKVSYD